MSFPSQVCTGRSLIFSSPGQEDLGSHQLSCYAPINRERNWCDWGIGNSRKSFRAYHSLTRRFPLCYCRDCCYFRRSSSSLPSNDVVNLPNPPFLSNSLSVPEKILGSITGLNIETLNLFFQSFVFIVLIFFLPL